MEEGGVGYDLLVGDWVEPHGKGTVKDMVFRLEQRSIVDRELDARLRITMPNPGDGFSPISPEEILEGSELPLPPTAHETGYAPSLVLVQAIRPGKPLLDSVDPTATSFFLRVRTRLNPDGKVESAIYGKLVGPIVWHIQFVPTTRIMFTYYVNPDGTRNVEFDPKRNLLQGLRSSESPDKP
jgi:hypothetical protein